ncbi:hypothetical protein ACFSL6_11785 [Paenibacillus thailandensis]|uniref:RNA polymerase sigma-70 region 4 domain-containing protein n=1 Tax=Paenibacillus thailandensis TaxID=393250 RepID=A0ABW5R1Y6_9BACL
MDVGRAKTIIACLSDGIDPFTGELFDTDSPYQNPDVVRALYIALKGIERLEQQEKRQKDLPVNNGRPWEHEEETRLIEAFDQGITIKDLSTIHARTEGAIRSRLIKLGKLELLKL